MLIICYNSAYNSFWNHAVVCLFLFYSFLVIFYPFITSPVLSPPHSPHLFLIPLLVYSLCSPSCVCQFILWCSPLRWLSVLVLRSSSVSSCAQFCISFFFLYLFFFYNKACFLFPISCLLCLCLHLGRHLTKDLRSSLLLALQQFASQLL